jgi:hypothetical protein
MQYDRKAGRAQNRGGPPPGGPRPGDGPSSQKVVEIVDLLSEEEEKADASKKKVEGKVEGGARKAIGGKKKTVGG